MNYSHFVGIDVSKMTFDASILDSGEQESGHRRFRNDAAGIQEMLDWTASFNIDINQTLFCAENMGCYVHLLSVTSLEKKFRLALASPLDIKSPFQLPDPELVKVRDLLNLRTALVKHKVSITKLIETAEYHNTKDGDSPVLPMLNEELADVTVKIKETERQISETMSCNASIAANYTLIQSIVGIGQVNAAGIIAATDNFRKFDNPRKFACYCGVAPFEHTSGTSIRGKTRTSKLAAKDLKVLLTRAALSAMVHDPQIRTYYLRKVSEGKHKASVINAIRAKIIFRCFAVVKRQTPFVRLMA